MEISALELARMIMEAGNAKEAEIRQRAADLQQAKAQIAHDQFKRTLDSLPEPDEGEGENLDGLYKALGVYKDHIRAANDRQRVLLEALQAAEDALKLVRKAHPIDFGYGAYVNIALDAIARTKTPHDDDAQVQS